MQSLPQSDHAPRHRHHRQAAIALYLMGHPLICKCGYVKLWHFDVQSAENSQHLIDWYTPSHIIHGFLFYWALWLLSRWVPMSFGARLVLAVLDRGVMGGRREHRLRHQSLSRDDHLSRLLRRQRHQFGDGHAVHGARLLPGRWWPVWLTVLVAIALELFVGAMIRDNLTLNVLMFIWPLRLRAALAAGR